MVINNLSVILKQNKKQIRPTEEQIRQTSANTKHLPRRKDNNKLQNKPRIKQRERISRTLPNQLPPRLQCTQDLITKENESGELHLYTHPPMIHPIPIQILPRLIPTNKTIVTQSGTR